MKLTYILYDDINEKIISGDINNLYRVNRYIQYNGIDYIFNSIFCNNVINDDENTIKFSISFKNNYCLLITIEK